MDAYDKTFGEIMNVLMSSRGADIMVIISAPDKFLTVCTSASPIVQIGILRAAEVSLETKMQMNMREFIESGNAESVAAAVISQSNRNDGGVQ